MEDLETLQQLVKHLLNKVDMLEAQVIDLQKENAEQAQTIKKLNAQLNQNSQNSSIPPSKDISRKKKSHKRNSRSRQSSDKPQGGQKGHKGNTLKFSDNPDEIIEHKPTMCKVCQTALDTGEILSVSKRQVMDIPPVKIQVTEHRNYTISCPCCGQANQGTYPENVNAPVQYGKNLQQVAMYQRIEQFLPYGRLAQLLADMYGCKISQGTLQNWVQKIAKTAEPIVEAIKESLIKSPILYVDESGYYVEGKRNWIHLASNFLCTYYTAHKSRGKIAVEDAGIFPEFNGLLIHDSYAMYWNYGNTHSLCNAHLLRELQGVYENDNEQSWAIQLIHFLQWYWHLVKRFKAKGETGFSEKGKQLISTIYDKLIQSGESINPLQEKEEKKRGRQKQIKARNLLDRFQQRKTEIIRFIMDWSTPFDNNLAERDVRMMKVQQKISGCFRSEHGAESFCQLRSYTSTMRKQQINRWQAIGSLVMRTPIVPICLPVQ